MTDQQQPECPTEDQGKPIEARCTHCGHVQTLTQLPMVAFEGCDGCRQYASFAWVPTAIDQADQLCAQVEALTAENQRLTQCIEQDSMVSIWRERAFAFERERDAALSSLAQTRALLAEIGPVVGDADKLADWLQKHQHERHNGSSVTQVTGYGFDFSDEFMRSLHDCLPRLLSSLRALQDIAGGGQNA